MSTLAASRLGPLRALALAAAWLAIPLLGATPGAAHAAVAGTVLAWGNNSYDQLNVPAGLSGVIAISSKNNHTLALKNDGTVVAWGLNTFGQTDVPAGLTLLLPMDFSAATRG